MSCCTAWNLAQWGDDVRGVCDALGIAKPIVYGVSSGGFVAQSYAPPGTPSGDRDPITPIAFSETFVAHLPLALTRFERFSDCGHGIVNEAPQRHFAVLRDFMLC